MTNVINGITNSNYTITVSEKHVTSLSTITLIKSDYYNIWQTYYSYYI